MQNHLKILILDDEKQFTEELNEFFSSLSFESFQANTVQDGETILNSHEIDVLLLDIRLPGTNGLDILEGLKVKHPLMEVIIVSAHADMDSVSKAISFGAFDYLRKPFRFIDIQVTLARVIKHLQLQRQMKMMEERNSLMYRYIVNKADRMFIGVSPQILKIYQEALEASEHPDTNVLITGEIGVGKKNLARIIHISSSRKEKAFCALNDNLSHENLWERELFGQKKGSLPTATADKMGFFEGCNGGTIYLDQLRELPLEIQKKLLTAIDDKIIIRQGDTIKIPIDVRIIGAIDQNVKETPKQHNLLPELLNRLNVLSIHIPALRERPDDIKPLLEHFVEVFSREFRKQNLIISEEAFEVMQNYNYPGNVRELRNLAERAVILCKDNIIKAKDIPW
jgi:DNA-binding NtrC family response regulator